MSAMDFPSNPVDGQTSGNYIYSSSTGAWKSKPTVGSVTIQSPTVPVTANPGDVWINTSDGTAFSYFDDGTSRQWMEILSSGVPNLATKANLSGGNSFSGTQTLNASSISNTPLITKANGSGQTANLQEWQDYSSVAKSWVDPTGRLFSVGTGTQSTVAASSELGGMAIRATATTAAAISFHVPTVAATNLGVQPDSKFSIGGWSLPTDSFTIDTTGRVRVANQPSFSVTNGGTANGVSTFIYTTINHNTGNYYNSSNGRFTAPIAGTYVFEATVGNNADFYVDLSVNGSAWRRSERRNGSATIGYFWIPVTMIVKLNAGDYVSVICNYGTANSTAPYAGFSGALIS